MEGRVTGVFAQVLETGRDRFNSAFAAALRTNRNIDAGEFMAHLAERAAPVVNSAAAFAPERAHEIGVALFDVSLELFAAGCLGSRSRSSLVEDAWREILSKLPRLVAENPKGAAAAVSNAAYNLTVEKNVRGEEWVRLMASAGESIPDLETFRKAGIVAAWRCGMAHYREDALKICRHVPLQVLRILFALADDAGDEERKNLLRALADDPWRSADVRIGDGQGKELVIVGACGGFRGFGGVFIRPPVVRIVDGIFNAFDGEYQWALHADGFGVTLHRLSQGAPEGGSAGNEGFSIDPKGRVWFKYRTKAFPELAGSLSHAATENTLAVTMPHSHLIFLIACVPGV